jgi:hypothetical protein
MKGDSGTSVVKRIQRPISLGPAGGAAFALVVDSQVDLTVGRIHDRNAVTTR